MIAYTDVSYLGLLISILFPFHYAGFLKENLRKCYLSRVLRLGEYFLECQIKSNSFDNFKMLVK